MKKCIYQTDENQCTKFIGICIDGCRHVVPPENNDEEVR